MSSVTPPQQQVIYYDDDGETTIPRSSALRRQFQDLSRSRDTPSESTTEERFVPTDDGGYIHEVTSRTTPRRRPDTGEEISTVTQRRVATISNPEAVHGNAASSNMHLKYSTKSVGSANSSRSPSSSTVGGGGPNQLNQQHYQNSGTHIVVSPGPSSYNFGNQNNNNNYESSNNYQQQQPTYGSNNTNNNNNARSMSMGSNTSGNGNWRYRPEDATASTTSASSFHNHQQHQSQGNFQTQPVYQQSQMDRLVPPSSHNSNNPISPSKNVGFGKVNTQIVEPFRISPLNPERNYAPLKYVTRRQLREMQSRGTHRNLPNRLRASSVPKLDEMIIEEQQQRQIHSYQTGSGVQRNAYDHYSEYPPEEDFGPRTFYDPDRHRSASQHSAHSANSGHGIRHSNMSQMSIDRYRGQLPSVDGDQMVERFTSALARIRGIEKVPSPPAYVGAAMRLLLRGTYLIHYNIVPHERYFMLRMINDDSGRPQPYFVWAVHAEAASYKERIHLAHLAGIGRGTSSQRFRKFQIDGTHLRGPFVGDEHSVVGSKYAFSFVFQSRESRRQVDVLALDDQTFRCWLLVCDYFTDVNSNAAADQEYEAETMAPDTPRSSVAPS